MSNLKKATTQKKEKISFTIEKDWKPTKVYELDEYLMKLIETSKKLKSGESIPVSATELNKRYGWKPGTCANSLRHAFTKKLSEAFMAKLCFHEVKDDNKKLVQLRVRHK